MFDDSERQNWKLKDVPDTSYTSDRYNHAILVYGAYFNTLDEVRWDTFIGVGVLMPKGGMRTDNMRDWKREGWRGMRKLLYEHRVFRWPMRSMWYQDLL